MIKKYTDVLAILALVASIMVIHACTKENSSSVASIAGPSLQNYSVTPAFLKKLPGFDYLDIFTLISSDDSLPNYRFAGSADGTAFIKMPYGNGYMMLVNNEDNYSVSRLRLDENLKPYGGEYILNSDGGQWRMCSGTLATPEENGFGPLFLSVGESSSEAMTHGIDPFASSFSPSQPLGLPGLGRWSGENSVPLNKDAFPGKTVIITGEDASDASGGQLALYLAGTVGDLANGSQYMLKRTDGNQRETDMTAGTAYDVEFTKIENHKTLTGVQIQSMVDPLKAIKFGRVEDLDYRKGSAANGREIYFNVTGQDPTGINADRSRTIFGRVYKLVLDADNPLKGKLTCILDGDDDNGIAKDFQNPDNICVTPNFAYIEEDSNTYGKEDHDAYIYQYNLMTGELKKVMEIDHRRTQPDAAKYNVGGTSVKGSWEYGALIDISDIIGIPNTFSLCIQPHTWTDNRFKGIDGGSKRKDEAQGSEVVILKGLPR